MKELDFFKIKLENLKQQASSRIDAIEHDIRHEGMSADWVEQASERENDEVLESLANTSRLELNKIKQALSRVQCGEYFICSLCGNEIPAARLELLPFTTTCVNCAEKQETKNPT